MPKVHEIRFGVRQKMALVLITVLVVALGTTGWFSLRQQEGDVLQETRQRGEDTTRFVSQSLVYSVIGHDYHSIQLLLDEIVKAQDMLHAKVISCKGNTMAEAGSTPSDTGQETTFARDIIFESKPIARLLIVLDNARIIHKLEARPPTAILRGAMLI